MPGNTIIEVPGPGQRLSVREGDIPEPPPKGMVVKTHFTGICHTDVHISENKIRLADDVVVGMEDINPNFKWPYIMGHEFCGEVYKLGPEPVPGSENIKVGDRVCVYSYVGCGNCGYCDTGSNTFCEASLITDYGIGTTGGYQSYFALQNKSQVVKIPDGLGSDVASLLGCSGVTAYNAVRKAIPSVEHAMKCMGEAKAMIIGAGGLGLWALGLSKAMLPVGTKIFMADIDESKLDQAKKNGADGIVYWPKGVSDDEAAKIAKQVTGGGVNSAMDFVGIGSTSYRGYKTLRKAGTLVQIGIAGGTSKLPLLDVALSCQTVAGVYVGNMKDLAEVVRIVHEKKVMPPPIHHVTPEQAADALIALREGKVNGRNVIKFI